MYIYTGVCGVYTSHNARINPSSKLSRSRKRGIVSKCRHSVIQPFSVFSTFTQALAEGSNSQSSGRVRPNNSVSNERGAQPLRR